VRSWSLWGAPGVCPPGGCPPGGCPPGGCPPGGCPPGGCPPGGCPPGGCPPGGSPPGGSPPGGCPPGGCPPGGGGPGGGAALARGADAASAALPGVITWPCGAATTARANLLSMASLSDQLVASRGPAGPRSAAAPRGPRRRRSV